MSDEGSLLADVDRLIQRVVATFGEPVADALAPIAASGSRHRARMVLSLARGGDRAPRSAGAAAVELLHLGTLVHDDIVDGSPLRRHSPTLHVALGMPVALWTADALYAEALHLADAVSPAGGLALGGALRRIADSQVLEALGVTTAALLGRRRRQDGVAVRGVVRAGRRGGGRLAPGSRARRGAPVRRLFQYVDDLQDIGGEADALGKPTGLDADNQLHTLPAADLVVSRRRRCGRACASSRGRSRARSSSTGGTPTSRDVTDRLLDAAARVLDRAPA